MRCSPTRGPILLIESCYILVNARKKSLAKKLQSCTNQSFLIKATYKELSFLVDSGGPYGPSGFFLQAARLHNSASALHHKKMVLIAHVGHNEALVLN